MNIESPIPLTELTRQEQLLIWLKRNNIMGKDIAGKIGASANAVSRWLKSEHLPSYRIRQLEGIGIPNALLPSPEDIPTGPKPKK